MACASAAGSSASSASRLPSSQREEAGVGDQAVLDHLGEARAQLARRQRAQRVGVGDHGARLVERADQVLAAAGG